MGATILAQKVMAIGEGAFDSNDLWFSKQKQTYAG